MDTRTVYPELQSSFIEASSKIERKPENMQAKQRTRHNVQGLRHWYGNNHHTKDSRG